MTIENGVKIGLFAFIRHMQLVFAVAVAVLVGYLTVQWIQTAPTPRINVPLPKQAQPGWTGDVLSEPTIYSEDPSVIRCYCPATGQLIDTVKTATKEDVDIAVEKAKAAQAKWRKTTFKQRALVLKTLLKFILENQGIYVSFSLTNLPEEIARVACRDSGVIQALRPFSSQEENHD